MMKLLHATIFCTALATPLIGHATTVTYDTYGSSITAKLVATGPDAWKKAGTTNSTVLPSGSNWTSTPPDILPNEDFGISPSGGDPCRYACSPFYGGVFGSPSNDGADGWQTIPFFTVFDPASSGTIVEESEKTRRDAVLTFSSSQEAFTLLWGSPDKENEVALLLGGLVVGSFWGSDFNWFASDIVGTPGSGAALLKLSGILFDGIRFSTWSNAGSFEFSNIKTIPAVPLPPALFALLTALGMVRIVFRKRRGPVTQIS